MKLTTKEIKKSIKKKIKSIILQILVDDKHLPQIK